MKRFLICQLACFGDCLYATTICSQLKKDFPGCHITWAVAEKYHSILLHNDLIDSLWVLPLPDGDYYDEGWRQMEKEAQEKKSQGLFDEIIFSQILPRNWKHFTGIIRSTILNTYPGIITVSPQPVVHLTEQEIGNVQNFAAHNKLAAYKYIVLFECSPGSGQSKVNVDFAINVAKGYLEKQKDICFILSTHKPLEQAHEGIIDGSSLSYRENAELTKYCTLLIGCSSGITWLATSNWAKKIPMLQLLNKNNKIYTGICYDHYLAGLDADIILERVDYDIPLVHDIIRSVTRNGMQKARENYHQDYKPSYRHFAYITKQVLKKATVADAYHLIELHGNIHKHYSTERLKRIFYYEYFMVYAKKIIKYPFIKLAAVSKKSS